MATQTSSSSFTNLVDPQESRDFIKRCIEKAGSTPEHAACLADVIIAADLRGHYSHGLIRVEMYTNEILNKQCDGMISPVIVKETCATALVDSRNGIGTVSFSYSETSENGQYERGQTSKQRTNQKYSFYTK